MLPDAPASMTTPTSTTSGEIRREPVAEHEVDVGEVLVSSSFPLSTWKTLTPRHSPFGPVGTPSNGHGQINWQAAVAKHTSGHFPKHEDSL